MVPAGNRVVGRLLNEVLASEVEQPDLTLFNILAREEAKLLLASGDEYF